MALCRIGLLFEERKARQLGGNVNLTNTDLN